MDTAMIVLTAIYVIATILICVFNYLSAKASKEQTQELKRQYSAENRPYITIELIYEHKFFYLLRLTNHGKRVANHVRISFNNAFLDSMAGTEFHAILKEQNANERIIGIGQHYDLFLATSGDREALKKVPIQGQIKYSDAENIYCEELNIDFSIWGPIYSVDSDIDDVKKEMEKQTRAIGEISAALNHIARFMEEESKTNKG